MSQSMFESVGGVVEIAASTVRFVAKERFVASKGTKRRVSISHIGANFIKWFLSGDGKVEPPVIGTTLRYAKLRRPSSADVDIMAELGGEDKAETTLAEMFGLMELQPNCESGALLNDGWTNIFYIRDQENVLRPVNVCSHDEGWSPDVHMLKSGEGWDEGNQVFYRYLIR